MARLLITGGMGFIGSHLTRRCLADGHDVTLLDNGVTGRPANIDDLRDHPRLRLMHASVTDQPVLREAMAQSTHVLHQAAIPSVPRSVNDPLASHDANATGTLAVLDAARRADIERVVLASSSSVYGDSPVSPKHEALPTNPLSPYAAQKAMLETYARQFSQLYGLSTVCLRYFNVYGPRQDPTSQYAAAIPAFIQSILNDQPPTIFGDGEQTRDFTYIDNVVEANLLAAFCHQPLMGEAVNIACGQAVTVNGVISLINTLLGKTVRPQHLPERPGDVKHSLADIRLAEKLIGFKPTIQIDDGLARTIRAMQDEA